MKPCPALNRKLKSNTLFAAATLLAASASAQTSSGDISASSGAGGSSGVQPTAVSAPESTGSSSSNPVADYFRDWVGITRDLQQKPASGQIGNKAGYCDRRI